MVGHSLFGDKKVVGFRQLGTYTLHNMSRMVIHKEGYKRIIASSHYT